MAKRWSLNEPAETPRVNQPLAQRLCPRTLRRQNTFPSGFGKWPLGGNKWHRWGKVIANPDCAAGSQAPEARQ